jgi:hypothetical protein
LVPTKLDGPVCQTGLSGFVGTDSSQGAEEEVCLGFK